MADKYGKLDESEINFHDRNMYQRVRKWLADFEATNYPGRPLTKQYFEYKKIAEGKQL